MKHEKLTNFLADNKDAFEILAKKIREAKSIDNINDEVDLKANKKAVEIVMDWIDEIWVHVNGEELDELLDDEPIFKMNKLPEGEI